MLFLEIIVLIFNTYSHITFNVSTSCSCTGGEVFAMLEINVAGNNENSKRICGKHCTEILYSILFLQNK